MTMTMNETEMISRYVRRAEKEKERGTETETDIIKTEQQEQPRNGRQS
jgi:hypothetical protein